MKAPLRAEWSRANCCRTRSPSNGVITITSQQVSVSSHETTFTQVAAGGRADTFTVNSVGFPARTARYARLTALAGRNNYASTAEINVLGTPSS